ncbi:pantoate--beta-alanine ligase [Pseudoclavibacter sp. 13-3]|uniref:pantoate--beta-alanine ligase n=1 Tax=Pseudoclavibacter sp. 13-3 TaxID=2901228 RepID=UPI001E3D4EF0|nr:pantoate--beta-alanine ligase [Pseudoclavibacter sp. 13-3]
MSTSPEEADTPIPDGQAAADAAPALGPVVMHSIAEIRTYVSALREQGLTVGLVPTMGALHAGHLSLVEAVQREVDAVVVSIFVNPTQFAPGEDYDAYPRTLEADAELLATVGADAVFAPTRTEMYPQGELRTSILPGLPGRYFEGKTRPTHFAGALTVVDKLLNIVQPDVAAFGEKDFQQLVLVTNMVTDLNLPVRILPVPIRRDTDGLALSSRNARLSETERVTALFLSKTVLAVQRQCADGALPSEAKRVGISLLEAQPGIEVDYLEIVEPQTFVPVADDVAGTARVILAARVGQVRLIDNAAVEIAGPATKENA